MPQPIGKDMHVDTLLTNVSLAYLPTLDLIWNRATPIVRVGKSSGKVPSYSKDDLLRIQAKKRAPGTPAKHWEFTTSSQTYSCEEIALAGDVYDEDEEEQDEPFDKRSDMSMGLTRQVARGVEKDVAGVIFKTGVWGTSVANLGTPWSAAGLGNPVADFQTAIETIEKNTGFSPVKAIIGRTAFDRLKINTKLHDYYKITTGQAFPLVGDNQPVTSRVLDLIAMSLGIGKVYVPTTTENTANEGAAFAGERVWNEKSVLIYYAPDIPSLYEPTAMYTFVRKGREMQNRRWRDDARRADTIEVSHKFTSKILGSDLGYWINDATA